MNVSEFVLKATPPRLPRAAIERAHLRDAWRTRHDRVVFMATAPAGFGKTTLLLQWRRWWLDSGANVAWLTAGQADHPARFALALGHALLVGGVLDEVPEEGAAGTTDAYAGLTRLLAAIAARGTPVGLVIDEAERLPEDSVRGALQYLLLNAPANLHVAIGTRIALPLLLSELAAKGQCGAVGTQDLHLRLEESIAILEACLGDRISLDDRAHLHDATEGWPLGLQLAISAIEQEPDVEHAVRTLSARHGALHEYFVTSLFSRLSPDVANCLVRASILDYFDTELFQTVTGSRQPRATLEQLARETPLMTAGEHTQWMRLHPLARDFLLSRFEALPIREQSGLHTRASRWYAERERFHEAATHALAAGDEALSQTYAARSLWALSGLAPASAGPGQCARISGNRPSRSAKTDDPKPIRNASVRDRGVMSGSSSTSRELAMASALRSPSASTEAATRRSSVSPASISAGRRASHSRASASFPLVLSAHSERAA